MLKLDDVDARVLGPEPLEAVFIRAPKLTRVGAGVVPVDDLAGAPLERNRRRERNRLEVLDRVIRKLGADARGHDVRGLGHQDGVAVGGRLCDELARDVASCAGLVLDHQGMTQHRLQAFRQASTAATA